MDFGVLYANAGAGSGPEHTAALAEAVEALGFESVWTVDHPTVPAGAKRIVAPDDRRPDLFARGTAVADPLTWLAWFAARTTRVKLGTGVLVLPYHNPVVLAKALATVDVLSGGRVIVGAGIGYLEAEFQAIGVPMARRGRRTEEYIAAMRALWSSNETFHGEFVSFTDAYSNPKPVRGTIPIILGGASVAAARRAGRIADGFYPMPGTDLETLLAELRSAAVEAGRDPDAITLMAGLPRRPETIRRLADLGFTRLLLPPPMCPPEQIRADLEARLAEAREHVS